MLTIGQMPKTLDEWYKATRAERDVWIKGTTDRETLRLFADTLLHDRNEKLDFHYYSATHPDYPDVSNLEITLAMMLMYHGSTMTEQHRPAMERQYRLELAHPGAKLEELALLMVKEDFGEEAAKIAALTLTRFLESKQAVPA